MLRIGANIDLRASAKRESAPKGEISYVVSQQLLLLAREPLRLKRDTNRLAVRRCGKTRTLLEKETVMHRFGSTKGDIDHDAITRDIDRLEALVADLWVVSSPFDCRRLFNERTLASAPLLEDWRLTVRPVPCLEGLSTGHPLLPGRRRAVVTSDVWLFSEELRLARSLNRWFHLGEPYSHASEVS